MQRRIEESQDVGCADERAGSQGARSVSAAAGSLSTCRQRCTERMPYAIDGGRGAHAVPNRGCTGQGWVSVLDGPARRLLAEPRRVAGGRLARLGVSANQLTGVGCVLGTAAAAAAASSWWMLHRAATTQLSEEPFHGASFAIRRGCAGGLSWACSIRSSAGRLAGLSCSRA